MKRKIRYSVGKNFKEREINYIPVRYIFAMLITVLEILGIIGTVFALCYFVPYFYLAALATQIAVVVKIVASDDNPDYKVPWLLFVLVVPIVGFMMYFLLYSRTLRRKYIKRMKELEDYEYKRDDSALYEKLNAENPVAASQAKMLCKIAF